MVITIVHMGLKSVTISVHLTTAGSPKIPGLDRGDIFRFLVVLI